MALDYKYGMKRYFDIGCQPQGQLGLCSPILVADINKVLNIKFMDIVRYAEPLSEDEIAKYELTPLGLI
jgi:hypothetical protein